jgi:hypothetical protein
MNGSNVFKNMLSETKDMWMKIIPFSGKKVDFITWEEKCMARARRKGYKEVILGQVTIPKDDVVLSSAKEEDKEDIRTREKTEYAYSNLILAIYTTTSSGKVTFNLVCNSKSDDYPDGNTAVAFKNLKNKYMSRLAQTLLKLHKAFYQSKFKKHSNPEVYIMYMEDIHSRIEDVDQMMKMIDDHSMLHIINNLTKDYESQVESMEDKIGADDHPLAIKEMCKILTLQFERINNKQDSDDKNVNTYHALMAAGQFKGCYRSCGKYGHKSVDCRSRGSGLNAGRLQGAGRSQGGV